MRLFQRLAAASTIATFLLVSIGGLVRATKSGLGCGDNWPHCPGAVDRALVIELSHRAAAGVVIVLIGLLVALAARNRRADPRLLRLSVAAFALVLFQALLGAIVVWLELDALSVVLHLAAAMSLLALLVWITAWAFRHSHERDTAHDAGLARQANWVAAAVLALLLVGSYVTGRDAGYVFPDWPLMNGRFIPDFGAVSPGVRELLEIHFAHRLLAAVVGVVVVIFGLRVVRRSRDLPLQAKLAHAAMGAFALEVLVGAGNVWTRLNPAFVTLHLALGALIWASVVGIAAVSRAGVAEQAGHRAVGSAAAAEPVL
jgi:cytochrome c oxidase assembly protein subunit 15